MPITLNPNIRCLILKYNNFQTVDASISFYPSLVYLDISSNKIETLHENIFIAQQVLKDLNLSDNNIDTIDTIDSISTVGTFDTLDTLDINHIIDAIKFYLNY